MSNGFYTVYPQSVRTPGDNNFKFTQNGYGAPVAFNTADLTSGSATTHTVLFSENKSANWENFGPVPGIVNQVLGVNLIFHYNLIATLQHAGGTVLEYNLTAIQYATDGATWVDIWSNDPHTLNEWNIDAVANVALINLDSVPHVSLRAQAGSLANAFNISTQNILNIDSIRIEITTGDQPPPPPPPPPPTYHGAPIPILLS